MVMETDRKLKRVNRIIVSAILVLLLALVVLLYIIL